MSNWIEILSLVILYQKEKIGEIQEWSLHFYEIDILEGHTYSSAPKCIHSEAFLCMRTVHHVHTNRDELSYVLLCEWVASVHDKICIDDNSIAWSLCLGHMKNLWKNIVVISQILISISSIFSTQILKSYTLDDCEAPIKPAFIDKLTVKLNERSNKVRSLYQKSFSNFESASAANDLISV